MEYKVEYLDQLNIYSLRNIGREVGVRAPTALTKGKLIDEIIQIKSGKKKPHSPTKVGRPTKINIKNGDYVNKTIILGESESYIKEKTKKEFIDTILKELKNKLNELL